MFSVAERCQNVPVETNRRALRVLVVEDEPDTAHSTQILLELLGYRVKVAFHGLMAVRMAKQFQPDVVLCDLALPGMDGFAVAAALRCEPTLDHVRLIALSGYAPDVRRGRSEHFEHHLVKPVDLEELQTTLRRCR